jgi:hypothetical protein
VFFADAARHALGLMDGLASSSFRAHSEPPAGRGWAWRGRPPRSSPGMLVRTWSSACSGLRSSRCNTPTLLWNRL